MRVIFSYELRTADSHQNKIHRQTYMSSVVLIESLKKIILNLKKMRIKKKILLDNTWPFFPKLRNDLINAAT